MYDPMTVAFEIPNPVSPWRCGGRLKFHPLITVWHVDPCSDGTDNSCGFGYPRLSRQQRSNLEWLAGCEARNPWFRRYRDKEHHRPADAECLLRGALLQVAGLLKQKLTFQQATELASSLVNSTVDNCRSSLAFLPGYHTNHKEESEEDRKEAAMALFSTCARIILNRNRRWYRHPRWHWWHWKLQVHALQAFKRWMWTRCCKCGKPFKYGESVCTHQWDNDGPQWFKSERNVFHGDCSGQSVNAIDTP